MIRPPFFKLNYLFKSFCRLKADVAAEYQFFESGEHKFQTLCYFVVIFLGILI